MDNIPLHGKKIAVIGSGAIGLYYGGRLADAGNDVHFLLRSDFETARKNGIHIQAETKKIHLVSPNIYKNSEEIGTCDIVLVAIKTTANDTMQSLVTPLVKDSTNILTLQNGLGNEELLQGFFPKNRILGGLCFVCLNRTAPAVVEEFGHGAISIGEHGSAPSEATKQIVEGFRHAGIETLLEDSLALARWKKLVWNIPFNGLSMAAENATVDIVLNDPTLREEAIGLMREVIAGADKLGLEIPQDFIDFQFERSEKMGPYKPSSLIDFLARRPVEVESIWGEPLRVARAAGIELPRLSLLYAILQRICKTKS